MELVSGSALSELLAEGSLEFPETVRTATQLTKALQFSYDLDIIHGDIKPSNVMIQEDGTVKLSDFGMARRVSEREASAVGGTPNYLAPELLAGQPPSMQSDMYAMGVMFFEMTFGRLPVLLSGRSVDDWLKTHRLANIEFPSPWPDNVPERWQKILERLLAKNPEDRYTSYAELERDLTLVRPTKSLIARRAPRMIAAVIDVLTVILFMLPLQLMISGEIGGFSVRLGEYLENRPVLTFLLYVLDAVPIAVYTLTIFFWRHSIGRALMQIRVVNRYGLKPYRGPHGVAKSIPHEFRLDANCQFLDSGIDQRFRFGNCPNSCADFCSILHDQSRLPDVLTIQRKLARSALQNLCGNRHRRVTERDAKVTLPHGPEARVNSMSQALQQGLLDQIGYSQLAHFYATRVRRAPTFENHQSQAVSPKGDPCDRPKSRLKFWGTTRNFSCELLDCNANKERKEN